ncbi:hypothetical protein BN1708_017196, partial [Verticillium longisporum]
MANMVMGSPHPAALYWGPEFVTIYNEAYIELAGQKHPSLMGMRYADAWSEIWDDLQPIMQSAWDSGQSTLKNDNQLFIDRHGFTEEAFFSWSLVPLVGSDGEVVGIYNPAFENTRRKVNERRMLTLREVGEKTAAARDVRSFWPRPVDLARNAHLKEPTYREKDVETFEAKVKQLIASKKGSAGQQGKKAQA